MHALSGERLRGLRCLVTGADGFLGRAVARAAKEQGAIVSGFGRRSLDRPLDIPWRGEDFADEAAVAHALEGQDVVFHLLGCATPAGELRTLESALQEEVKLTAAMLRLLRGRPAATVIFASSGGAVYGVTERIAVREDRAPTPISAYGAAKLLVESHLDSEREAQGPRYRILRIANAYGPGQSSTRGQGFVAAAIRANLDGRAVEVWGDGTIVRDYVYVDDVAEAFILAARYEGDHKIFNVGSGRGRSLNEVLEDIGEVLGRPCAVNYRHGRPVDVPWNVLDICRIRADMNWRPGTEWLDGLRNVAEWLSASRDR